MPSEGGTPSRDIVYLNGERVAMRLYGYQAGWYFFINDHLGTPQKIVNEAGEVVWAGFYQPFGKAWAYPATVTNNFRFPGQYYDAETGLHYNWNRYYDPDTGRYLTPDPIGLEGGINLYAYVTGNPVNLTDPTGEIPWDFIWDALNIAHDIITGDKADLAADIAAFYIPYFPAGITKICKIGKKAKELFDPKTIRFTQDSISNKFSDGKKIKSMIDDLKSGRITADDISPIRVFEKDGELYTLDNRRLKAFQEAGIPVPTVKATPEEVARESWKFTTKNNGMSVRVRGGGL